LAGKTTWSPSPWLGDQTWLLKDNTVVQTPPIETSTSGRRARIIGTTKSVSVNDLDSLLSGAVEEIARQRGTNAWLPIPTTPDDNLSLHGSASPARPTTPDFTRTQDLYLADPRPRHDHLDIVFEFVSVECPTVTAMVWVYIGTSANDHEVRSGITYRMMHKQHPARYAFWARGLNWVSPFSYYEEDDEALAARAMLSSWEPITDIDWINQEYGNNPRRAVFEALKLVKQLVNVEQRNLPVWRDARMPEPMTYRFTGRTTFTNALYQQMLEFVQTKATVDRIRANYQAILRDMASLGLVMKPAEHNEYFEAVMRAFGDDMACHMIPLTDRSGEDGKIEIVPDHEHTVSIDFPSGTLVVNCLKDQSDVVEQWNFARFQAELKGELDEFLGFARQTQQKRNRKRVSTIVKDRSPDEADLVIAVPA
jgi:hypothetical protein